MRPCSHSRYWRVRVLGGGVLVSQGEQSGRVTDGAVAVGMWMLC